MKTAALISVYDKTSLEKFAREIETKFNCQIIASGGTSNFLHKQNIKVTQLAEITKFDEILDGRVKTLHHKIYAALLAKKNDPNHQKTIEELKLPDIKIVCVNLYPFMDKVEQNASQQTIIENIDIGGVTLIRAAAKNYHNINILTNPQQYQAFLEQINGTNLETSLNFREKLAADAFAYTALYEANIANYFMSKKQNEQKMNPFIFISGKQKKQLKYGENPSQKASIYTNRNNPPPRNTQYQDMQYQDINGKNLGYNNIKDVDTAVKIVSHLSENYPGDTICSVVKHSSPCGCAIDKSPILAWQKSIDADSVSAFGGVVACNAVFDENIAEKIKNLFLEVIVAKKFTEKARKILAKRKNIRLLEAQCQNFNENCQPYEISNLANGDVIAQTRLNVKISPQTIKKVTLKSATEQQIQDMIFAYNVVSHAISNAIVVASNRQTCSIAGGQTNRIDAVKMALVKSAKKTNKVLASDAFFPFSDAIEIIAQHGIKAVIQPGGSIKDEQVIKAADDNQIAMYFTSQRVFKH